MAIGINDLDSPDDLDDLDGFLENDTDPLPQNPEEDGNEGGNEDGKKDNEEDFISFLLKSKKIEDKSKIKFKNEEGEVDEVDWDSLSNEDKFNLLNTFNDSTDSLDDTEIQLINTIRSSGLNPLEYIQHIELTGIDRYIQNNLNAYEYKVDQYTDDELFIADFMSRMDVTEEEANEALEKAKSNEALFAKLIEAIRNEYKTIEEENLRQEQIELEQYALEQYNLFADSVVDEINAFKEFSGYELNLENDDMQELYDFITGQDAAGNNYFAKALSNPKILVETAWLTLNGRKMIEDITDYFQKEITQVREESYKKGQQAAKEKINKPEVVFKNKSINHLSEIYGDLDDF